MADVQQGDEWFDLTDPESMERFDEIVDAMESAATEVDPITSRAPDTHESAREDALTN